MRLYIKILILTLLAPCSIYPVDSIITIFLQKYPYFKIKEHKKLDPTVYSKKLKQPGYVSGQIIKKHRWNSRVPGVMLLYAGNLAMSDKNGQVQFPKLQQTFADQETKVYLLITKGVGYNPDYIIAPSTIHNWGLKKLSLNPDESYEIYLISLKKDEKLKLSYFDVQKSKFPDIEDKNKPAWRDGRYIIPLNTIIIIADPQDIFVPIGATVTEPSANLILPPIYIKKSFCFVYNSLSTLAIKQYFSQEEPEYQLEKQTISQIQQRA